MTREEIFKKTVYVRQLEIVSKRVKVSDTEARYLDKTVCSPEDVFRLFRSLFSDQPVELFVVIHLKSNNGIAAFEIVNKGVLNSSLVTPREIFKSAILQNAAAIILCHNHPSGNCEPSAEDIQITMKLVESGKLLGIPVNDHIVFGENSYASFAERLLI
jgi:DNA repair protein RadC